MKIEIQKLTPGLAEDYVRFLDVTPHDVNIDEHTCYCVTWRSDDSYIGNGDHWFPTREERRERALQFVGSGVCRAILPITAIRSWAGVTQTRTVSGVSNICVRSGR